MDSAPTLGPTDAFSGGGGLGPVHWGTSKVTGTAQSPCHLQPHLRLRNGELGDRTGAGAARRVRRQTDRHSPGTCC